MDAFASGLRVAVEELGALLGRPDAELVAQVIWIALEKRRSDLEQEMEALRLRLSNILDECERLRTHDSQQRTADKQHTGAIVGRSSSDLRRPDAGCSAVNAEHPGGSDRAR